MRVSFPRFFTVAVVWQSCGSRWQSCLFRSKCKPFCSGSREAVVRISYISHQMPFFGHRNQFVHTSEDFCRFTFNFLLSDERRCGMYEDGRCKSVAFVRAHILRDMMPTTSRMDRTLQHSLLLPLRYCSTATRLPLDCHTTATRLPLHIYI